MNFSNIREKWKKQEIYNLNGIICKTEWKINQPYHKKLPRNYQKIQRGKRLKICKRGLRDTQDRMSSQSNMDLQNDYRIK